VALLDPNPLVRGAGVRRLKEGGIEVRLGECADEAAELVEAHAKYTTQGRPFVTLLMNAPADVAASVRKSADLVLEAAFEPSRLADLLRELGSREVTSMAISCGRADAFLSTGLVDKIVAGADATVPPGYAVRRRVTEPAPHLILYPSI
jgi:hypothetical protein